MAQKDPWANVIDFGEPTPQTAPQTAPQNVPDVPEADISNEAWYPLYLKAKASPAFLKAHGVQNDAQLRTAVKDEFLKIVPLAQFRQDFNDSIKKQGGPGLSPEARAQLGANDSAPMSGGALAEMWRPFGNLMANGTELGRNALLAVNGGLEATATGVDREFDKTGIPDLTDRIFGNKLRPGAGIMALLEAFPDGGGSAMGFKAPVFDTLPPALRSTLNTEAEALFNGGANRAQMDAWAKERGLGQWGPDMDAAIATRDQVANGPAAAANRLAPLNEDKPIDLMPADVGGPMVKGTTAGLAQTIVGGQPIVKSASRTIDQLANVRNSLADAVGSVLDPEALGNTVSKGATNYIGNTRTAKNSLYAAAEKAAGDATVTPTKAIAAIDEQIADLAKNPVAGDDVAMLEGLKARLAQQDWPVTGVRAMGTKLREQFVKDNLRGTDLERRTGIVMDAAKEDVVDSLKAQGAEGAANLYAHADKYARERIQTIDNILSPIIGKDKNNPRSGEAVAKTLMADLQNNNARAAKLLNALPADAQGDVRASIIGKLGLADADGFSLDKFATSYSKIGNSAKRAFFGSEGKAALDDIATIADARKATEKYSNRSNTGRALDAQGMRRQLLQAGIEGGVGLLTGSLSALGTYGAARLLSSPRIARWIARAPKTTLSLPSYVERLDRIAKAEPDLAGDIQKFKQALTAGEAATNPPPQPPQTGLAPAEQPLDYQHPPMAENWQEFPEADNMVDWNAQ